MAGLSPSTRNDLARLQGVRFVTAVESGDGHRLDESIIKSITGGDAVQARFLYREFFEFVPQFKLWMATNHPPRIRGTDHAIWRRVMLVPFAVTIPDDKRDPALQDRLLGEAEGILDWLVEGCVAYCKHGLDPPPPVRSATQAYRDSEDMVGQFLADRAVLAPNAQCAKKAMYADYTQWCERNGERPVSQRALSKVLQSHGLDEYRGSGGMRYWIGIRLVVE
jgi:putative DNA primase/helicase